MSDLLTTVFQQLFLKFHDGAHSSFCSRRADAISYGRCRKTTREADPCTVEGINGVAGPSPFIYESRPAQGE